MIWKLLDVIWAVIRPANPKSGWFGSYSGVGTGFAIFLIVCLLVRALAWLLVPTFYLTTIILNFVGLPEELHPVLIIPTSIAIPIYLVIRLNRALDEAVENLHKTRRNN